MSAVVALATESVGAALAISFLAIFFTTALVRADAAYAVPNIVSDKASTATRIEAGFRNLVMTYTS